MSDWEDAPAGNQRAMMLANDAALQASHPDWPTGGTARQRGVESNGNDSAVSPKGARGAFQVMDATRRGVEEQTGRKYDPNNFNDSLAMQRYIMKQNMDRFGSARAGLNAYNGGWNPANWNNPETANYTPRIMGNAPSADDSGWEDAPTQSPNVSTQPVKSTDDGWEEGNKVPNGIMDNLKGLGVQAANLGVGALEAIPAGVIGIGSAIMNGSPQAGVKSATDFMSNYSGEKGLEALGMNTSDAKNTSTYRGIGHAMDFLFDTAPGMVAEGANEDFARRALSQGGMAPDEQTVKQISQATSPDTKAALQLGMLAEPLVHLPGLIRRARGGDKAAAAELDKMMREEPTLQPEQAPAPDQFVGPQQEGMGPLQGQPNAGPQRPIFVSPEGQATPAGVTPSFEQMAAEQARRNAAGRAAQMGPNEGPQMPPFQEAPNMGPNAGPQLPGLFPEQGGEASPFQPNRLSSEVQSPFQEANPTNLRQMSLDFGTPEDQGTLFGNPQGDIGTASQMADVARLQDIAQQHQMTAAGDFFGQDTNVATPYEPNRLSSDVVEPFQIRNPTNLRQRGFDFEALQHPETMTGDRFGNVGEAGAMEAVRPFRDAMERQVEAFNKDVMEGKQGDLFSEPTNRDHPYDQFTGKDARSLTRDEFEQTMNNLADAGRMERPVDMDVAFDKYLDTISDKQGGLFDRPTIAENFAKAVRADMIMDRVNNHPIVKANRAKVEALQAQIEQGMKRQNELKAAVETLNKSIENIGKNFEPAAKQVAPWAKDGVVNMHTFGHLPTLWKSLGAILKGIHGLVFKSLDKALPKIKNLDSGKKIFAQGLRDAIEREAKRDWSQTINEKPKETLKGVPGLRQAINEFNPFGEGQQVPIDTIKEQARQAPDLSAGIRDSLTNHIAQGGLMLTNLTRNPIIKYVTESVDRAVRDSRAWVRDNITGNDGLQKMVQRLNDDELTGIRSLMEMNEGVKEFSPAELKNKGFTDKQISYYQRSLELERQAFNTLNEGRAKAGLSPVDRRIAHIAGYFMGDFKRVITNAEGKVIAVLSHNYRPALETITKRFMEIHPEAKNLKIGDIQLQKLKDSQGAMDARFQGYMNVLNELKDTNADVSAVVSAYRDYMQRDAAAAMQNRAKFKSKEGVIGAEGRKSWQSAKQNAIDGARQQLRYLESMSKWSEMQKAIEKAKEVLGDESIDKPEAKRVAQQYLDGVQGRNQGAVQHALNGIVNGIADVTGVGPSVLKGMNNTTKSLALMKFVGLFKLSHSLVTLMQPMQAMPGLNSLLKARGADLGMTQVGSLFKGLQSSFDLFKGDVKDPFNKQLADYMKANGTADVGMSTHLQNVTNRSLAMEKVKHVAELNVTIPEQGARTFVFSYYAHMLKDLGLPVEEALPTAHNLMRYAMVDYAPHERSMMFGKMGIMGDIASTLTRFKYNQISQHLIGASEVARGNSIAPLMTVITSSLVAGGIRGVFAYEAINQGLDMITKALAKAGVISKPTNLDELVLKTLGGLNNSKWADMANWGITSGLGINMTGSLTNADTIPTDPLGALVPYGSELTNLGGKAVDLAVQPNKQNAKRFVQQALPNSMKGLGEEMFTDENGNFFDPNTGQLQAKRSTSDRVKRALSFRPLEESKRNLVAQVGTEHEQAITEVKHTILERAKRDMDSQGGKLTQEQVQKYTDQYTKQLGGDPGSFVNDMVAYLGKGQHLDRLQRAQGIPTGKSLSEVTRYQRFEELKGNK